MLEENLREYLRLPKTGRRFTIVGDSDSHRLITNWVGHPRNYVKVADDRPEAVTAEEIGRQVLGGHVTVANGIFLFVLANGVAGPGDTISESWVTLQISARTPEMGRSEAPRSVRQRRVGGQSRTPTPNAGLPLASTGRSTSTIRETPGSWSSRAATSR